MKICVTGGTGFIGRWMCERLLADGHEVVLFDLWEPDWELEPGSTFFFGDIRDKAALLEALPGCDAVFNLAAAHHDFGIDEETFYAVNEHGSKMVCEACDEFGITDIVFYSTVAIFGDAPEPHLEDSPKAPANPYGASKLAGERVFNEWAAQGGDRKVVVIRPTITFGPRNFANMYSLIRQIESGLYLNVGNGKNIKSLSYVENLVDLTVFIWNKADRQPVETLNFIDKPDFTAHETAGAIYKARGKKPPKVSLPLWFALVFAGIPFDILIKLTGKNIPISSMRIKKMCIQTKYEAERVRASGYEPVCSLEEGINRMVRWYQAGGSEQKAIWRQPPKQVQTRDTCKPRSASEPAGAVENASAA